MSRVDALEKVKWIRAIRKVGDVEISDPINPFVIFVPLMEQNFAGVWLRRKPFYINNYLK